MRTISPTKKQQPVITVITAQPLTKAQTAKVKKLLEARAGQTWIVFKVDPDILGGIQIKIGDQHFDASLDGQLRRLQLSQDRCLITTAIPLSAPQYAKLTKAIAGKYGNIGIDEVIDPTIIGGIKLVIGSTEYDWTVAGRLTKLHKQAIDAL